MSINTTLNSSVVFSCEATGNDLFFRVNNIPASNINVMADGFSSFCRKTNGTMRAELKAKAYEHNNNTEVKCRAITNEPPETEFSNTVILMIQG